MKNRKRALRRHHRQRLYRKRRDYHGNHDYRDSDPIWYAEQASFFVETPCSCSCDTCGNPRRSNVHGTGKDKLTIQERKELCKNKYDIQEITTEENL